MATDKTIPGSILRDPEGRLHVVVYHYREDDTVLVRALNMERQFLPAEQIRTGWTDVTSDQNRARFGLPPDLPNANWADLVPKKKRRASSTVADDSQPGV